MRVSSILRAGLLALALYAPISAASSIVAQAADQSALLQNQQNSSTGPYDGASDEAAKRAFY
jgi:hypothetical protein